MSITLLFFKFNSSIFCQYDASDGSPKRNGKKNMEEKKRMNRVNKWKKNELAFERIVRHSEHSQLSPAPDSGGKSSEVVNIEVHHFQVFHEARGLRQHSVEKVLTQV
jgi:hypothetical protein